MSSRPALHHLATLLALGQMDRPYERRYEPVTSDVELLIREAVTHGSTVETVRQGLCKLAKDAHVRRDTIDRYRKACIDAAITWTDDDLQSVINRKLNP